MDKWAPIAPSKPTTASGSGHGMFSGFGSVLKPHKAGPSTSAAALARAGRAGPRVGRWPEDILVRIAGFLPVHDVPAFARANRALARIARDETNWKARCRVLAIEPSAGEIWSLHSAFASYLADEQTSRSNRKRRARV